jgi:hypothetical protein
VVPRLTKIGLKGLSNYYSYEIAVKAARREASEVNKKGYSQGNIYSKERARQQL